MRNGDFDGIISAGLSRLTTQVLKSSLRARQEYGPEAERSSECNGPIATVELDSKRMSGTVCLWG
jgi:hypothetical protein